MLSPLELLEIAQDLAVRIPRTAEYAEERNATWLAVGNACLASDEVGKAERALRSIDELRVQAPLRMEIGKWAGSHEESEVGRRLLEETVSQIAELECWVTRKDVTDLVPAIFKLLGNEAVQSVARQLQDPFTAGNVYVTLADYLSTVSERGEQLAKAEKLAMGTREGDRDHALRWVFRGYESAGLFEDAERVRRAASKDPEELTRYEDKLLKDAQAIAAEIRKHVPQDPPDTPAARLRRFLDYKFNDLKVVFLTDACIAGGIDNPEMEEVIRSDRFQRVEAARPTRLSADASHLDAAGIARFLFGRPVSQHSADQPLLIGENIIDRGPDDAVFVRQMTGLFREFGTMAETFSAEQVEQGLWFILGHPFWLHDMIYNPELPLNLREECLRAMLNPFRDYYMPREGRFPGSAFFMWWDLLLQCAGGEDSREIESVVLEVLRQILQLPGKECQFAALHGLNHMHPNSAAASAVREYLEEHRESLTAVNLGWVESCAKGTAM